MAGTTEGSEVGGAADGTDGGKVGTISQAGSARFRGGGADHRRGWFHALNVGRNRCRVGFKRRGDGSAGPKSGPCDYYGNDSECGFP